MWVPATAESHSNPGSSDRGALFVLHLPLEAFFTSVLLIVLEPARLPRMLLLLPKVHAEQAHSRKPGFNLVLF